MLRILIFLILFIPYVICRGSQTYQYIWTPKHNMEQKTSWLNENLPCEDDLIQFDQAKLAVSYISGGLKSDAVLLPDNGIIFMDNYAIIGEKADWQCPKRSTKTEAFFEPKDSMPNIFDWKNWKINDKLNNGRPKLHCDRIPSELDEANFPIDSSFRAEVDAPLVVGKLNYSNQYMSNSQFILTMEGQFIFQIGPKLETKLIIDHIEYQMPNTDVIRVVDGPIGGPKGVLNSNTQEPQFSEICRFVECPDWKPYCTNPVKPFGHCCETCGAIATFFHPFMSLNDVDTIVSSIAEQEHLPSTAGLDISRIDKTAVIPKYQISVITENLENFDENSFYAAVNALYEEYIFIAKIHDEDASEGEENNAASMFTGFEINYSLETGKIRLRPLLETLLFIGLLGAVIGVYLRYLYKTSPRFRLWLSSQDVSNRMSVAWRNAKEYTEEKVEVILRPAEPLVHAFAHYRNQPELDPDPFEAASYQSSSGHEYSSEFRNPTFVEYSQEELETKPELKEVKEENLFDLNF